jgi:hypothetical protein
MLFLNYVILTSNNKYDEKKLLGSGGYAFAKLTDEEQNKSNSVYLKYFSVK